MKKKTLNRRPVNMPALLGIIGLGYLFARDGKAGSPTLPPLYKRVELLFTTTPATPALLASPAVLSNSLYVDPALLAQVGIYSNTPLTPDQAAAVGYGEPIPAAGSTDVFGGQDVVFDPIYQSGRLVAGWHYPGTVWDWTSYSWI